MDRVFLFIEIACYPTKIHRRGLLQTSSREQVIPRARYAKQKPDEELSMRPRSEHGLSRAGLSHGANLATPRRKERKYIALLRMSGLGEKSANSPRPVAEELPKQTGLVTSWVCVTTERENLKQSAWWGGHLL